MRYKANQIVIAIALTLTGAALSGCHLDMWRQAKIKPYWENEFFPDRQGSRPLVVNTVARGWAKTDDPAFYTGKVDGKPVLHIPVRAVQAFVSPKAMLERGKDRYEAYCTPCHGKMGNGNGFIMQRGLGYWQKLAASYHTDRLRKVEDGHIYDVITNGYGIMYSYAARIQNIEDRWAIVAYIRALQLAQSGQVPVPVAGTAAKAAPTGPVTVPEGRVVAPPGPAPGQTVPVPIPGATPLPQTTAFPSPSPSPTTLEPGPAAPPGNIPDTTATPAPKPTTAAPTGTGTGGTNP